MIKELLDSEQITFHIYGNLICHNGVIPKLYGSDKIQKPDLPLRPVVSTIDSFSLVDKLKSFKFVREHTKCQLVSFDCCLFVYQ